MLSKLKVQRAGRNPKFTKILRSMILSIKKSSLIFEYLKVTFDKFN